MLSTDERAAAETPLGVHDVFPTGFGDVIIEFLVVDHEPLDKGHGVEGAPHAGSASAAVA